VTPRTGDQSVAMALPIHRTTQTQNKSGHALEFELTIPVFWRIKTFHNFERAITVVGWSMFPLLPILFRVKNFLADITMLRGGGHYATSRKLEGSILDKVIGFFILPNPSSLIMALGSTQPLTEITTMNLLGGKGRPKRKTGNLTAICEPIV
jgi:hypothetical protein